MSKKHDAADRLAQASGLSKDKIRALFQEAQDNHKRLDECPRHHFDAPLPETLRARLVCTVCGGEMSRSDVVAYAAGYAAHGGDRADIWPAAWGRR